MELYREAAFQLQKLLDTELYKGMLSETMRKWLTWPAYSTIFTVGSDEEVAYVISLQNKICNFLHRINTRLAS